MDEADRLLDASFEEDLEVIFDNLPFKRQTLLFSATLTDTLSRLREVALNEPFYWQEKAELVLIFNIMHKIIPFLGILVQL